MTAHIHHPHVYDPVFRPDGPVLDDECERCQEHAAHPLESLDGHRITRLAALATDDGPWLSVLDRVAAREVAKHMRVVETPAPRPTATVVVAGDWLLTPGATVPAYAEGYEARDGGRWNGWVVPEVTRPVLDRIIARQVADDPDGEEPCLRFDGDALVIDSDENRIDRIEPDADGFYRLDFGWVWDAVDRAECAVVYRLDGTIREKRPLDSERVAFAEAVDRLRDVREGVDGYGAWPEADEMHRLIDRFEEDMTRLLDKADS